MPTRARSCATSWARIVDVLAVERDRAVHARAGDRVVHAIEAAQERRLAAARRADHRQHLIAPDVETHVLHRVLVAVMHVDVARRHDRVWTESRAAATRSPAAARRRRRCRCAIAAPRRPGPRLSRFPASSESAGDVIVGLAILRRGEDLARRSDLHQLAQVHETGDVRRRAPPAADCGSRSRCNIFRAAPAGFPRPSASRSGRAPRWARRAAAPRAARRSSARRTAAAAVRPTGCVRRRAICP